MRYDSNAETRPTPQRDEALKTRSAPLYYGTSMVKRSNTAQSTGAPTANPNKTLKELFDERDRTRPGSNEERAAEKILEALFPHTNAG
jgi:hypothetical protein